jgi:hypothetical protein
MGVAVRHARQSETAITLSRLTSGMTETMPTANKVRPSCPQSENTGATPT